LDAAIRGNSEIRDWKILQDQIKDDLKKNHKLLPLSAINQLMILSNIATLQLKGASQIGASEEIAWQWHEGNEIWFARCVQALACHYQIFEQLPREKVESLMPIHSSIKSPRRLTVIHGCQMCQLVKSHLVAYKMHSKQLFSLSWELSQRIQYARELLVAGSSDSGGNELSFKKVFIWMGMSKKMLPSIGKRFTCLQC
jgi:hypothetical protein